MQVAHQITAPYRFNFLLWVLIPLVLCRSSDRSVLYTLNVFLYSVLPIYILYSELSILRENEEVAASRLIYSWWRFLPSFACFSLAPIPTSLVYTIYILYSELSRLGRKTHLRLLALPVFTFPSHPFQPAPICNHFDEVLWGKLGRGLRRG